MLFYSSLGGAQLLNSDYFDDLSLNLINEECRK